MLGVIIDLRSHGTLQIGETFTEGEALSFPGRSNVDASYDFSYVANEAVDGFAERFHGLEWKAILTALIRHRAVLDDAAQYVALHHLPMSSTIAAIARSRHVRGLLSRCLRRGFDYCRGLIDGYAHWPREAISELARRGLFNVGYDLIAACLFKRSDLADELRQIVAMGSSTLSGMPGMIVRHAPEIAVAGRGAAQRIGTGIRLGLKWRFPA